MPGEIRTVCKVDFDKPAKDQHYLHVRHCTRVHMIARVCVCVCVNENSSLTRSRTGGILTVGEVKPISILTLTQAR